MLECCWDKDGKFRAKRLVLDAQRTQVPLMLVHPAEYRRLAAEAGIELPPEPEPLPEGAAKAIEKALFAEVLK